MESYVQGALQKELHIAPFVEHFKQLLWERLTDKSYDYLKKFTKHCIFADLLIVSYRQGPLRKELLIVSFVELFKNANLGKCY